VYSEPLSALLWRGYRGLLLALPAPVVPPSLALLPGLFGGVGGLLVFDLCCPLSDRDVAAAWAAPRMLLCGLVPPFFPLIETYPLASLGVLLYLTLALRYLRDGVSIFAVALSLALAIAGHLACLLLVPSYLFLVLRGPAGRTSRIVAVTLPLGIVIAIFFA